MSDWGFETRQIHAGAVPDPTTGAAGRSHLPDDELHVPRHGPRGGALRAGGVREHLHQDHEPDPGRVRGADRVPRRWRRRASRSPAARRRRPSPCSTWPRTAGTSCPRPPSTAEPTTCSTTPCPSSGSRSTFVDDPDDLDAWRAAIRPNTKAFYAETLGNPKGDVLDFEGVSGVAHEHGIPLVVDNTLADALPGAAAAARRRHRRAFGHEVHRRPRHVDRWGHRRRRHVRLRGKWPVPRLHRA